MKKYLPLIVFVVVSEVLFCLGLLVKDDLLRKVDAGIVVSQSEEAIYHIIQMLLWIPIGTISGFGMLLFPGKIKSLLYDFTGSKHQGYPYEELVWRIVGFGLILFTFGGIKSYFDLYFDLLFK